MAQDDLPRFEQEFKDYLNQNTIRDIAGFSAQLNKHEKLIRDRVETINRSLVDIDYNDGRYIRLVPDHTPNTDVREFRAELRACTDNVIGGGQDEQYSEEKFLQVKQIIDRFKGREGMTDQDRNWTRRVTDVRQWFVFSASERWRDDGTRVRALHRLGREVGGPEGEAGLHDSGCVTGVPVQAGLGGGALQGVPVRGHRRGVQPGFGAVDPLRPQPVHPARTAALDRDPPAEDPRDRTTCGGGRFRRQSQRQLFPAAVSHHRRVPPPPPRPRR